VSVQTSIMIARQQQRKVGVVVGRQLTGTTVRVCGISRSFRAADNDVIDAAHRQVAGRTQASDRVCKLLAETEREREREAEGDSAQQPPCRRRRTRARGRAAVCVMSQASLTPSTRDHTGLLIETASDTPRKA
jgi:hypothetical protein